MEKTPSVIKMILQRLLQIDEWLLNVAMQVSLLLSDAVSLNLMVMNCGRVTLSVAGLG